MFLGVPADAKRKVEQIVERYDHMAYYTNSGAGSPWHAEVVVPQAAIHSARLLEGEGGDEKEVAQYWSRALDMMRTRCPLAPPGILRLLGVQQLSCTHCKAKSDGYKNESLFPSHETPFFSTAELSRCHTAYPWASQQWQPSNMLY